MNLLQEFDLQKSANGIVLIGIDEAGRGPLAGPVVACAVCIPKEMYPLFEDVNDSKKLTEPKRLKIYARAKEAGISYGVGFASAAEIDSLNILQATFLAMRRAAQKFYDLNNSYVLVDGNHKIREFELPQEAVIDGDAKSLSIALASVIAKTERDSYMKTVAPIYPHYGFEGHKGYGAKTHIEAILKHGPCKEHRKTFAPIKNMLEPQLF
ncbi:ribonuclease HII [Elusimicrobium posterum]|uniref:ribonuclease HII n=1 Tax=Elusimicrobium posterum TaxID=3116653 RepID=UPI003C792A90